MQVTTETINGELMTVVWHGSLGFQYKSLGISDSNWRTLHNGVKIALSTQIEPEYGKQVHFATALPPLPQNPTADDAWLLHLYASHGLHMLHGISSNITGKEYAIGGVCIILNELRSGQTVKITDCTVEGNRVDVAIVGSDNKIKA